MPFLRLLDQVQAERFEAHEVPAPEAARPGQLRLQEVLLQLHLQVPDADPRQGGPQQDQGLALPTLRLQLQRTAHSQVTHLTNSLDRKKVSILMGRHFLGGVLS